MKRIFALLLALVMIAALLPANAMVSAASVTAKPFTCLNGKELWEDDSYVYVKPYFFTSTVKEGQVLTSVSAYGSTDIKTIAQKMKEDFDSRPEGARVMNFQMLSRAIHHMVEYSIYFDKAVAAVNEWLEAFLSEYKSIGGKLDAIALDVEYFHSGAWYVTRAFNENYTKSDELRYNNANIFADIVNDPRYKTELRPMLEKYGFDFYPASKQTAKKTEIYSITTRNSSAYNVWNYVMALRMSKACDDAVYKPLTKYYPDALISDYQVVYSNAWQKAVKDSASPVLGNRVGVGGVSTFNAYAARPNCDIYGMDSKGNFLANPTYTYPASYNEAAYKLTAFNTCLWEINIFKNMYEATESKKIACHITYFNYHPNRPGTYSNTPYYAENIFHIAMLDPQPMMSYILEEEVFANGQNFDDPNIEDYGYNIEVVSSILKEVSRVAGASDRKPIEVPATWNSKFILSGMYAGGRNIWRITPDTSTGVTLEQFKVKDEAPTFYINGQTITFPQGRIIKDSKILQVGSCGYWVETPANVMPVITNDTDRYSKYPSLLENFESYAAGSTFDSTTARPNATWEVGGNASVQSHGGDNALALTGSVTLNNVKLPANITAGDSYAKQQAWEVTVTLPNSGELKLLTHSDSDLGIKLADGKMYYDQNGQYQQLAGVSLSAGSTYTVKKEVDFRTAGAFKASYSVYDANGNKLGSVEDVAVAAFTIPVQKVGISCANVSGTAYIDDYKLYPTGVTTELEAYDFVTGYKLDGTTSNKDAAYRLSWMNASSEYKVAKVFNNGTLVETIEMAPGQDGVATGVVKGSSINFSVTTESGTAASAPNYDSGDFSWTAVAESIGLASGKSNGGSTKPSTPTVTNPADGNDATTPSDNGDATAPTGGNDATTPSGNGDATVPTGGNDATNPSDDQPDTTPKKNKGLSGEEIVLIVILVVLLLGGGFALLWFIIKPKWLMGLKDKIKNWFQSLKKKK